MIQIKKFGGWICYYQDGLLHRLDGPAKEWNGPAVIIHGAKYYYYNNEYFTSKEIWFSKLSPEQKLNIIWKLDEL